MAQREFGLARFKKEEYIAVNSVAGTPLPLIYLFIIVFKIIHFLVLFIQTNTCQIDGDLDADWLSVLNVDKAAQYRIRLEPNLQLKLILGIFKINANGIYLFLMLFSTISLHCKLVPV